MFMTKLIMEITIERVILLVIVFAAVIDGRVPSKNTKAEPKPRNKKTNNRTMIDVVVKSTPTKRDLESLEEVLTINETVIYINNIAGVNNNEPLDLTELLKEKLKALIGKDDATKLEFIKNIKEVLGVNSYENKEDDALEALRRGDNAEYATENSVGRVSNIIGNLATVEFTGQGLPNRLPLLPASFNQAALRRLLNNRRFNRFFVNKAKANPRTLLLDVMQNEPKQAKLHIPKQTIRGTILQNQSNVQQLQATPKLETETVFFMNHQEIQKPVFDSNDNAYPYEPIRKR